ncbi:M23 family metallopeptidase [Pontibacter sp. 172403-2]|uniref:M23 family metallopeptidase n=1 Tax=Pontibacter rufus TaxID=2791028 RepID=UPI0018AFB269|nr:M23 family metallopeptidase [Pontibacter sp. 172403-2]MBF9253769.1 M23 family metallopeptidase [Pontibacter sp. 172403-2]
MKQSSILSIILYTGLVLLLAGCGGRQTLRGVFQKQTPYERYVARLKDAKLDNTALGQDWLEAGQKALTDSIRVTLPFREIGYFSADAPKALGYRIEAKRGERLVVNLEMKARETAQVFMDLFEVPDNPADAPELVASADTAATSLTYEVEDDQQHLLRVQPELLRSGQYTITIQAEPTLAFPVPGKTSRNIASVWGDERDGGARRHEGVDIFAKRGTPALAASDGFITRVSTTPIGGKVVWLSDMDHRQSLYYAHLDSQLVAPGQRVQTGDTLGLIGNTGNAITTNPHLHFGIYRAGRGATNPYPYLHEDTAPVPPLKIDAANIGNWIRVSAKVANVRWQPSTKSGVYLTLPRYTPLQVTGGTSDWYRVALPDGAEAYIAAAVVEAATKPVKYAKLKADTDLLDEAQPGAAAKDSLASGSSVAVLGIYSQFNLVRNDAGAIGWINTDAR